MDRKEEYKKRYPGINSFSKDQASLFFGREKESKELHYLVSLEKVTVLFGRSGLGKTSLLNAGLAPLLEKSNYRPIRIRLNPPDRNPGDQRDKNKLLEIFKLEIGAYKYRDQIPFNNRHFRLWDYVKAVPFKDETGNSYTPVFIFDQFEEFFIHQPDHQREFLEQLAELAHNEPPYRVLEWITSLELEERTDIQMKWADQPDLKIIFVVRSDRLASMQSLTPYISTVLRNRYELKPLSKEQAEKAIEKPAMDPSLVSGFIPAFSFDKNTLTEIVEELSSDTEEIESSQLQLICSFIEDTVYKRQQAQDADEIVVVNNDLINPAKDFPAIIDDFYEVQLQSIPDVRDRERARQIIEDELVINGYRESLSQRKMNNVLGVPDELISQMIYARLIKEEVTSKGVSYEVTHDILVAAIEKSRNRRKILEEQRKLLLEKEKLEQETKRKDENLKEQLRQLALEIQLKNEAIEQRRQIEDLGKKLKRKGLLTFLLTIGLLIATAVALVIVFRKKEAGIEERDVLINNTLEKYVQDLSEIQGKYDSLASAPPVLDTGSASNPKQKHNKPGGIDLIVTKKLDSLSKQVSVKNTSYSSNRNLINLIDSVKWKSSPLNKRRGSPISY
jgi:hypothetical protein